MTVFAPSSEDKLALWQACFGDSPEAAAHFYRLEGLRCFSFLSAQKTVGMAHILPVRAGECCGGYLYAVGVARAHRGRGIFRALMRAAERYAVRSGYDFLCLIPASEALDETYRRYGYEMAAPRCGQRHDGASVAILPSVSGFSEYAGEAPADFPLSSGLVKRLTGNCPKALHFDCPMGEG